MVDKVDTACCTLGWICLIIGYILMFAGFHGTFLPLIMFCIALGLFSSGIIHVYYSK